MEMKVRAWDNVKNRMYYLGEEDYIHFYFTGSGIAATDLTEMNENMKELHHLQYMQYTGMKDRNGKEIYEGDVLNIKCFMDIDGNERSMIDVVQFEDGCFAMAEDFLFEVIRYAEILGNIYERPELLQQVASK